MAVEVVTTGYGRSATRALAAVLARVRAGGPLRPVTVVVPSNLVGLSLRRLLGGPEVEPGLGGGLAHVGFVTPFQLAARLAADLPGEHRPLTNPVLGAAVRRVLAESPGPFAAVAGHHATEAAVAALYARLSHAAPATLDHLAGRRGTAAVAARLHRAVAARLEGIDGEDELARAVATRPDLAAAVAPLGHVVWFAPAPVTPALAEFLAAVVHRAPATVVVARCGDPAADRAVLDTCRRAGVAVPDDGPPEPPAATTVVSVTDADDEVRAVVRRVLGLVEAGVPADRIAVFTPTPDPYTALLATHLAGAGLPANGPARDRLLHSAAGRTLLAALDLPAEQWRRDRVMALVAGAPVRHGDGPALPARWEELSRRAGVVAGPADWAAKLAAHAATRRARAAHERDVPVRPDDEPGALSARVTRLEADAEAAESLAGFVAGLVGAVDAVGRARTWRAKVDAALALLERLLGSEHHRTDWPEPEQAVAEHVVAALHRLALLDPIDPEPSAEVFRRALVAELDVARGRSGRFGQGVQYGPLASAPGQDLDAVFVLGLVEGLCPASGRDDSLLPDALRRELADPALPTRADRLADQHRALLAALAAAPPDRRVLVVPRGDLRSAHLRFPSRWALDGLSRRLGRPVRSTELEAVGAPLVEVVASHAEGVRDAPTALSLLERDVGELDARRRAGADLAGHPALRGAVGRGIAAARARRSPGFTEWDGNLAGASLPSPADGTALGSATGLERWATCGFRYLLHTVLGLGDRDEPERIVDLSPLDRGSVVHTVLERFLAEVIAAGAPDPDTPWTPAQRHRLAEIAAEQLDELERLGRTGRPLRWRLERSRLLGLLQRFLDADDAYRRDTGAVPVAAELGFGPSRRGDEVTDPPVELELPDGRVVRLRGSADRVDLRTVAGGDPVPVVLDYKTGAGSAYADLDDDPFQRGTVLQLGIYAEAARRRFGGADPVAEYWMVNDGARFVRRGTTFTAERRAELRELVGLVVAGIERGAFPLAPGERDRGTFATCRYCEFDAVCPRDRGEHEAATFAEPQGPDRWRSLLGDAPR